LYESKMEVYLKGCRQEGIEHVIFGDLFLEDLRRYREERLSQIGMKGVFPLWKQDTTLLAQKMIQEGFKAILTCVDLKKLPKEFAGRTYDEKLLNDFPEGIDPCGENGEFHSFVYGGPIFKKEIPIQLGETVEREGFAFADVLVRL
ncbi:MAG: ATP-binding protein, partial [Deltaproteobacteria bacterium]|nr:ATP-binding protein [Deltaproteobacteria bacterium]